jgi:pyruvate kinase
MSRLRRRRTKIVATLGPASDDPAMIAALVAAGVEVFRLNFAHGDHAAHESRVRAVRAAAARADAHVALLADLAGPKIRAGRFRGGSITLAAGDRVTVTTRDVLGEPGLVPSDYESLHLDVRPGDPILLDDGRIELRVVGVDGPDVAAAVVAGGILSDRKGMNLPGVALSAPALSDRDRADASFAAAIGIDVIGLSFIRRAADLEELARHLGSDRARVALLAKVEKPEALGEIDAILAAADAIMVARGDLGVELPPERVPVVQDDLVGRAIAAACPVVVATQMLESMTASTRPTRAEVADIAHAVKSGADALMLAGETASGAHPVETVAMMDRVIRETEAAMWREGRFGSITRDDPDRLPTPASPPTQGNVADAVSLSIAQLSRLLGARAILVFSHSGHSARAVCAARPAAPVIAVSPDAAVCRRMNLLWGAVPAVIEAEWEGDPTGLARRLAGDLGLAESGEPLLVVRGFHSDPERNAPTVSVITA